MSKSIRISDEAKEIISKMSKTSGIPETRLLKMAVEEFARTRKYAQIMLFEKKGEWKNEYISNYRKRN